MAITVETLAIASRDGDCSALASLVIQDQIDFAPFALNIRFKRDVAGLR